MTCEIHAFCDLLLEIGLAPHEPHGDQEQIGDVLSEQRKQRFHEQIGADQGTVQIDAQRDGIHRPGRRFAGVMAGCARLRIAL